MLTVAEVRRAAAFCGMDLKILLIASGHRLKVVPSSIACSTCKGGQTRNSSASVCLLEEEGDDLPTEI